MTPTQYLSVFARFRRLIAICAAAGLVLALIVGLLTSSTYTSSSTVLVSGVTTADTTAAEAYESMLLAQTRIGSYADLARGPALAEDVIDELDLELEPGELADRIEVVVPEGSTALSISVQDTDRDQAQKIASQAAESMVEVVDDLETARGRRALLRARVVAEGGEPTTAEAPPFWRNPLLGLLGGVIVGLGLAVVAARLDRRVRDGNTVSQVLGAPVLGELPASQGRAQSHTKPAGATWSEAVRRLRTGIFFLHPGADKCLTIAITSPHPIDDVQKMGDAVAVALVDAGARVLLVEGDLREPRQTSLLDEQVEVWAGLTSYLNGTSTEDEVTWRDTESGVDVVPAGFAPANPGDLLHSQAFATLLEGVAQRYDFVVVTAPATSLGTDAAAIAARCDGTLLTVVLDRTQTAQLQAARDQLQLVDAHVLGAVLLS